jgi:hypothetical protein
LECCAWRLFEPWLTMRLEAPLWMGRLPQSKHCAWPCEDTALLHILRSLLYSDVIDVDVGGFVRQLNRAHRNWHLKTCVPAYVALRAAAWALEHAGQFVLYKLTITATCSLFCPRTVLDGARTVYYITPEISDTTRGLLVLYNIGDRMLRHRDLCASISDR